MRGVGIEAVSLRLAGEAERIAVELIPEGHKSQNFWVCGDVDGSHGKSLKINLSGRLAGQWKDWSSGEGGDLIDLWAKRRGVSVKEAYAEAKKWLGIQEPESIAKKAYARPKSIPSTKPEPLALVARWFGEKRHITTLTLGDFQIGTNSRPVRFGGKDGVEKPVDHSIAFPFFGTDDKVFAVKYLNTKFASEGGKAVKWAQEPGCKPGLFGWQALDSNATSVVICEGEIDAMSLHQVGISALSIPSGVSNLGWIEEEWSNLEHFRDIVLMMDADEAGENAVDAIARRLGRSRCRIARLNTKLGKDPNEYLVKGLFEELKAAVVASGTIPHETLVAVQDFENSAAAYRQNRASGFKGIRIPWVADNKCVLEPGQMSIWFGINGHGKSQMLGQMILEAILQGFSVVCWSGELSGECLINRLAVQAYGRWPTVLEVREFCKVMAGRLYIIKAEMIKSDELIDAVDYAEKRHGCTLAVVDPLVMISDISDENLDSQKIFAQKMRSYRSGSGMHLAMVAHPRKLDNEDVIPSKMDLKGSGAFTDLADQIYVVWRNKALERQKRADDEGRDLPKEWRPKHTDCQAMLVVEKNRHQDWEGYIKLNYISQCHQFYQPNTGKPIYVTKYLELIQGGGGETQEDGNLAV